VKSVGLLALFFALLLLAFLPTSSFADDQDLINELTEILTLYETGLTELQAGVAILQTAQAELETGLIQSQRELAKLRTAQMLLDQELVKSQKLIGNLEQSLQEYRQRTAILTTVSIGLGALATAVILIALIT